MQANICQRHCRIHFMIVLCVMEKRRTIGRPYSMQENDFKFEPHLTESSTNGNPYLRSHNQESGKHQTILENRSQNRHTLMSCHNLTDVNLLAALLNTCKKRARKYRWWSGIRIIFQSQYVSKPPKATVEWLPYWEVDCPHTTHDTHLVTAGQIFKPDSSNVSLASESECRKPFSILNAEGSGLTTVRKHWIATLHPSFQGKVDVLAVPQVTWTLESCSDFSNTWCYYCNTCNQVHEILKTTDYPQPTAKKGEFKHRLLSVLQKYLTFWRCKAHTALWYPNLQVVRSALNCLCINSQ